MEDAMQQLKIDTQKKSHSLKLEKIEQKEDCSKLVEWERLLVMREEALKKNNLTLAKGQAELVSQEETLKKNNLTLEKGQAELKLGEDKLKLNNLTHDREEAVLRNNKELFTQQSRMEASSMSRRENGIARREDILYQRELKFYVKRDREEVTKKCRSGRTQRSRGSLGSLGSTVSLGSSSGSCSSQDFWNSRFPQCLTPNRSKLNALKAKVLVNLYSAINRDNSICQIGKYLKRSCPCLWFILVIVFLLARSCLLIKCLINFVKGFKSDEISR